MSFFTPPPSSYQLEYPQPYPPSNKSPLIYKATSSDQDIQENTQQDVKQNIHNVEYTSYEIGEWLSRQQQEYLLSRFQREDSISKFNNREKEITNSSCFKIVLICYSSMCIIAIIIVTVQGVIGKNT